MVQTKDYRSFWKWFLDNEARLSAPLSNRPLLKELQRRIRGLGDYCWEIGPGIAAAHALTISPGGDKERLAETQAIVLEAPEVDGWEFHSAKPPKDWKCRFEIAGADGKPLQIDATAWQCSLLEYPDGFHEVLVVAKSLGNVTEDYQHWAVEVALDGLLGERRRLESIDQVTVIDQFSKQEELHSFPFVDIGTRV